jgi:hypothetical protein
MPVTSALGQLTAVELTELRTSVRVLLRHRNLLEPIAYAKLDTLGSDLQAEHEDRIRISHEFGRGAPNPEPAKFQF